MALVHGVNYKEDIYSGKEKNLEGWNQMSSTL